MSKELISSFRNLETNKELRTVITATGDILFCLSDICNSLDIVNASSAKKSLEKEYNGKGLDFSYPLQLLVVNSSLLSFQSLMYTF